VISVHTHDAVIIGAGLAGLRCAVRLAEAGLDVVLLEAEDAVGGRQRTDSVDGFLLDRGFQVLNPAYPAVRRWVDVDELGLQRFPVGVRVRREDRAVELRHPLRHPTGLPAGLRSGLITPRDAVALARWIVPALARPAAVVRGADRSLDAGWKRVGLRGPLRGEVLEPFLAGVLAEDAGSTSDAFARLLVRMFVLGAPGVPAQGIGAVPAQLAAAAERSGAEVRLRRTVTGLGIRGDAVEVAVEGAPALRARATVVAVGPAAVSELLDVPRPATKGLQTWWFAADAAPSASALLAVDGRRRGPVVNTVVMSNAAPSYAPPGRHLVEATCLLPASERSDPGAREREVRRQLGEIWGADAHSWSLLRRDDIVDALPVQPPPLRVTSPARVGPRIYAAGDHRDTASIQGALVSGERAARAVLADRRAAAHLRAG
jgi:glycine/D-amino acid oxidase-like deaminating enzyme